MGSTPWRTMKPSPGSSPEINRLTLPDEFNPIKIYQTIAGDPRTGHGEESAP